MPTNLEDLDSVVDSSIEVNVVRTDTSSDTDLQVLCLLDEVAGQVTDNVLSMT